MNFGWRSKSYLSAISVYTYVRKLLKGVMSVDKIKNSGLTNQYYERRIYDLALEELLRYQGSIRNSKNKIILKGSIL